MALLKSLIQRLLDSRTTPAQAGHASKPGSAVPVDYNPSASVDNWGPVLSNSTAVSDGYIWATGRTTSDKGFFQINTQALQITTTGTSNPGGEILNLFTPVSKGQPFSVYGRYLEQVTVRLVKTIGGGYKYVVRRALSCLRPSFNFSQRSFFKVNIPTLLINADQVPVHKARQSQETARRTLWLLSPVGLSLRLAQTVRQTTHGLGFKTPPEELHTSPMQFANTKRLLSQCKKEMFLLLTSALITRTKAPFCLSLLKQQNNLGTGGVTC